MKKLEDYFSLKPTDTQLEIFEQAVRAPTSAVLIVAPTAFGKSVLADALLEFYSSQLLKTNYLVPTNILVDQFTRLFNRHRPMLARRFHRCVFHDGRQLVYTDAAHCSKKCPKHGRPQECGYIRALQDYKASFASVANYWIPYAHKVKDLDVLIVDEAHLWIENFFATINKIEFDNDLGYPHTYNLLELIDWAETTLKTTKKGTKLHKNLKLLLDELTGFSDQYVVSMEDFNEEGVSKKLVLYPKQVSASFNQFVRGKKLICLSATISEKDLTRLGYTGNFTIIEADSPIPIERRPIHVVPALNMSAKEEYPDIKKALEFIRWLRSSRPDQNGFVHVTYKLAERFRLLMELPEFREMRSYCMFHNKEDKIERFNEFLKKKGAGVVFFGAGMHEGVDLKDDIARWQVIPKIAWESFLSSVALSNYYEDQDSYEYETAQKLMQACGRVCRHPNDFGETFIIDRSFQQLDPKHFFNWFTKALQIHREYGMIKMSQ